MALQPMKGNYAPRDVLASAEVNKIVDNVEDLDARVTTATTKNDNQDSRLTALEGATGVVPPRLGFAFLPTGDVTVAGSWVDWGPRVTITDPPASSAVKADVDIGFINITAGSTSRVRVGISLNGGSSWTYGPQMTANHLTGASGCVSASAGIIGTTSGNVVVKVQIYLFHASTDPLDGHLSALVIPQ